MEIKPVKRVKVGEQVFEQMKCLLLAGKWKPGERIPSENELAEMFDVSRITVRQALQKLVALDLLETRLGDGSYVKQVAIEQGLNELIPAVYLGEKTNIQVFEFREMIDTESVYLATQRATEKDFAALEKELEHMEKAKERDAADDFADADLEFHFEIGRITRNPLIIKTNSILRDILRKSMYDVIKRMGYSGISYHQRILEAMKKREADDAMKLMREHIRKNSQYFLNDAS